MRRCLLLVVAFLLALPALTSLEPATSDAGDPKVTWRKPARLSHVEQARVELGRRLFFDPAASPSGARSCASCHSPDHGWSDPLRVSADDVGDTRRHSQTLLDAGFHANAHWDGEFASVADLVVARLGVDPRTMTPGGGYGGHSRLRGRTPFTGGGMPRRGSGSHKTREAKRATPVTPGERRPMPSTAAVPQTAHLLVSDRLMDADRYGPAFKSAFGTEEVTLERIAVAIGAFTQTIESTASPYDRFKAGQLDAISESAKRGYKLFRGRAGCVRCHDDSGDHAFFTDFAFHNTGVARHQVAQFLPDQIKNVPEDERGSQEALRIRQLIKSLENDERRIGKALLAFSDQGRAGVTGQGADRRTFKTPTLRDVAKRGPYMHNGRFETLEQVVRYYAKGCGDDPEKSHRIHSFTCSDQDAKDLVAFLESLSGETRPGMPTKRYAKRAPKTELTFVNARGEPMKKMAVRLVPVGDVAIAKEATGDAIELETDGRGRIRYKPGNRTHMRIVLPEGVEPLKGALVPDCCRKADVQVPVAGRMTFLITFGANERAPDRLVAIHAKHKPLVGHPKARTLLRRVGEATKVKDGLVAKYECWARTDAGNVVKLVIPGRSLADQQGEGRRKSMYAISAGAEYRIDAR